MKKIGLHAHLNPFLVFAEPCIFHKSTGARRYCYVNAIYLIEGGAGRLQVEGTTITITPHTIIYIPSLTVHTWHSDPSNPLTFRCAYFDWKYIERPLVKCRADLFILNPTYPLELNHAYVSPILDITVDNPVLIDNYLYWHQLFVAFSDYYDALHVYEQVDSLGIQANFSLLLKHFLEWTQRKERFLDPRIIEAVSWIEQCVEFEPIYEMMRKMGLSRSYFQKLFKKQIQMTPSEYWNQIRIRKVKDDLKNSLLSITEIAEKHQFSSIHYFSKMFKVHTGETPSAFRRKNNIDLMG